MTTESLEPTFRNQIAQLIVATEIATGVDWIVTSCRRTMAEQQKIYDQGRKTPGPIVTKAPPGYSAHNFGLACFDDKTEILTMDGWYKFSELPNGVPVASWNNDQIYFEVPLRYISYPYDGEMISIKNRSVDALVTPNHKMIVQERINKNFGDWKEIDASKLCDKHRIPTSAIYLNDEVSEFPLNHKCSAATWWEFMGWWISEGSAMGVSDGIKRTHNSRFKVTISQSKENNLCKWALIDDCLKRLGYHYNYYGHEFVIHSKELWEQVFPCGGQLSRRVPRYIINGNTELLKTFLHAAILGDGTYYDDGATFAYFSACPELIDDISEIATRTGHSWSIQTRLARISKYPHNGNPFLCKPQHYIRTRNRSSVELRNGNSSVKHISTVQYSGMVYCVTVPSGAVVIRRNGKMFIAGNCDLAPMKDGKIWWKAPDAIWKQMADIALKFGLTAGYYFKSFKDMPHVESPSWKDQQKLWKEGRLQLP